MSFLLDTDTISYLYRGESKVVKTFTSKRPSEIHVSAISVAELRLGAVRKGSIKINHWLDVFFNNINILDFDHDAAEMFGKIGAKLLKQGTPIGELDTMIGAQALVSGLTIVTHNTRHYAKIAGLRLQSWAS